MDRNSGVDIDTASSQIETEFENNNDITDGIRPEFKEAMDSYELFFDEYVKFMKKCKEAKDITSMMSEYSSMMQQYINTMAALQEKDESTAIIIVMTRKKIILQVQ